MLVSSNGQAAEGLIETKSTEYLEGGGFFSAIFKAKTL